MVTDGSESCTDRATHYHAATPEEGSAEEAGGQVSQALRALGIRLIQARSPQAHGRSERACGTIQGRLPQELRLYQISDYAHADRYLEEVFVSRLQPPLHPYARRRRKARW